MTDEATVGLSLDSTLAVWSMVITAVTSENDKSSIQYIRWPKRWPVEHSAVADSCPDVKNERKDGFQQAFIDDFNLSLKVEDHRSWGFILILLSNTIKGDKKAANCKGYKKSLVKQCFVVSFFYNLANVQNVNFPCLIFLRFDPFVNHF